MNYGLVLVMHHGGCIAIVGGAYGGEHGVYWKVLMH
jgi:hypothetical protein